MNWKTIINLLLKATIFLLVVHALVYSDLPQYQEKGMQYRIIGYPLAAISVYLLRLITKTKSPYPYNTDILISTIIVSDMLGNALGFYGSIEWWDDFMHLINNCLITFIVLFNFRKKLKPLLLFLFTIGLVSWLQIAWEIAEYITFVTTNSQEMTFAYRDTIGDIVFGQSGALLTCSVWILKTTFFRKPQPSLKK